MGKLKFLLLAVVILAILFVFAVPALLRTVPDRYVARLPMPLQEMAMPAEQAPVLPTAAHPAAAQALHVDNTPQSTARPTSTRTTVLSATSRATESARHSTLDSGATPTSTSSPVPSLTPTPWPLPAAARMTGFRHQFQQWNNCGPATLAMTLSYFDINLTQEDTAAVLKPDPEDRNVSPYEMAAFVNEHTPYRAIDRANGNIELLRRLLANNIPVIIEVGIEPPGEYRWLGWYGHYLLLVAYDDAAQQFWVYDSWFGTSEEPLQNAHPDGRVFSYEELETYWPQFNRNYVVLYEPDQEPLVEALLGDVLDDQRMWGQALVTAQAETTGEPDDAFAWFNLGTSYNALGRYAEAAAAFDQARAIGLPWRMLWYQFGPYEAYFQTGRYEDIVLLADLTLKDRPYFEESYYYRGLALAALGEKDPARRDLAKAFDFNPNFTRAATALEELN